MKLSNKASKQSALALDSKRQLFQLAFLSKSLTSEKQSPYTLMHSSRTIQDTMSLYDSTRDTALRQEKHFCQ